MIEPEDVAAVRLWTFNLGFYNMVWGAGAIAGAVMLAIGEPVAGRTLLMFTSIGHVIMGLILLISERRLWRNAVAEAALPLLIVILLLL